MKKKYSTKPVRRSLGKGGSTLVRRSLGEDGFFTLRALLAFTLCFVGVALAISGYFSPLTNRVSPGDAKMASESPRYMPVPGGGTRDEAAGLAQLEQFWHDRLTFPTGRFDPAWVRAAADQHARMPSGVPVGLHLKLNPASPFPLTPLAFTALGPQPERMTGCSGCYNYTTTEGRVNDI